MPDQPVKLTSRMKHTLTHAGKLARSRGHDYLGTEHVLLALIDDPRGIAGGVIHRFGYADAIRDEVIRIIESDGYAPSAGATVSVMLAEAGVGNLARNEANDEGDVVDHDDAMRMLKAIATAFDQHDLEGIMVHFADDAVFEGPRGTNPWGTRFVGRDEIRDGFAARFAGIPDIRYQDDEHFVDGDRGASEWTLSGTTTEGQRIEVRGCDLWTFRDGKVVKKDSYWKIRTTG